jgi:hypothetical protein
MTYVYNKDERQSYLFEFACDSLNYYVASTNFTLREVEKIRKGTHVCSGDSLVYPLNMKAGDTLPDAWCRFVETHGEGSTAATLDFKKRKVEALDTLNLSCGKIPAYRITSTKLILAKVNSTYSGKREERTESEVTEWFSPQFGIVKGEERTADWVSRIVLESYSGN